MVKVCGAQGLPNGEGVCASTPDSSAVSVNADTRRSFLIIMVI
jgi:hypothetical protein